MGFPRLDEDTLHQGTGSQAEGRQRARGWCEAQPRELGSCAQVIPVLPPVLLGASPWSYELAAQASAGEELCVLPPAALEKQKGHFDQDLRGMKGRHQTEDSLSGVASYLVQIVFLTVPRGKESLVSHLFPVCSQGALKEGAKPSVLHFVGLVVLHCVLGSYRIMGHVGKKGAKWSSQKAVHGEAPSALTKDQVCTKVPSGAFALLCT